MKIYKISRLRSLLWTVFKDNYIIIISLFTLMITSSLFWSLKFIKYVFGGYFASPEIKNYIYFKKILGEFAFFFCGNIILILFKLIFLSIFNNKISKKIKISLFNKLLNNEFEWFQKKNSTEMMSYINSLADSITGIIFFVVSWSGCFIEIPIACIFITMIDYRLLVGIIIMMIIYWSIFFYFLKKQNKHTTESYKYKIDGNNYINDIKNNILICKILDNKNSLVKEYYNFLEKEERSSNQMNILGHLGVASSEFFFGLMLSVFFFLIYIIMNINELSSFDIITKYGIIIAYLFNIFYSHTFLLFAIPLFTSNINFLINSDNIFNDELKYNRENNQCPAEFDININNISLIYNNKKILSDINLKIHQKDIFIIKGKSGIGKSTICSIILGLIKPDSGNVTINSINNIDRDIFLINETEYRSKYAYIPQMCTLFNKTIKENIIIGLNKYSKKNFELACELSDVCSFVIKIENKYDFILENLGSNLSGGQRARVCIARAILRILEGQSNILICDEIFSSLSHKESIKICENIKKLIKNYNLTAIFIDHTDITEFIFKNELIKFNIN